MSQGLHCGEKTPYIPHGNIGKKLPILRDYDDAFAYLEQRRNKKQSYRTLPFAKGRYRVVLKTEKFDRLTGWSESEIHIEDTRAIEATRWAGIYCDSSIVVFYKDKNGDKFISVAGFDGKPKRGRTGYYAIYRRCGINVQWDPVLRQSFVRQLTGVEDTEPSLGYVADHTTVMDQHYEPRDKEQAELIAKLQKQKAFRSELRRIHRSFRIEREHSKRVIANIKEKLGKDLQALHKEFDAKVEELEAEAQETTNQVEALKLQRDELFERVKYLENLGKKAEADEGKFSDVLNRL